MTSNRLMRFLKPAAIYILPIAVGLAQRPKPPDEDMPIRTEVKIVIVPSTVMDKNGNYVNGLQPKDFRLYDNEKLQSVTQDQSFQPISLVVAVQANNLMETMLPKIQKIGNELSALVTGENGEAAVIAFDHRIQQMQDFTPDGEKIDQALKKIKVGSTNSRMIDAVTEAVRMLKRRPENRRRVILLISETRDKSSEGKLREALTDAQFANVIVYSVDVSHLVTSLATRAPAPRAYPIPPEARHTPNGTVMTPTEASQQQTSNAIPLFEEIFKSTKGLFVLNPLQVFTRYTGGKEYFFVKQRALETAIADVGAELHSQYLLSYTPNNQSEAGFHQIRVEVNRPDLKIRTRPGYWLAGGQ